jgi:hypothetical protein
MTRVYVLQVFPEAGVEWYTDIIKDIKLKNPDYITVISLGEINVELIFDNLFNLIEDWLIENKKYMYVLWAGPDKEIRPYIHGVNTLGSAYGNLACVEGTMIDYGDVNVFETSNKLFTSYNNNPKYERKLFVDLLVNNDLINDGIVTYRYPDLRTNPMYDWKYHDGSVLSDEPDFQLNSNQTFSAGRLPKSYFTGFIDIVAETDYRNDFFVPTEKTAKPWGALKPYLVISSMNYHKWLYSEYGIEMYDELFDYNFDSMLTVEERIQGIIDNLLRLKALFNSDPSAKFKMYEQIKSKLKHNRNMALQMFKTLQDKDKLIPECLKFITTENDYELLGEVYNNKGHLHFITNKEWHLRPRLGI